MSICRMSDRFVRTKRTTRLIVKSCAALQVLKTACVTSLFMLAQVQPRLPSRPPTFDGGSAQPTMRANEVSTSSNEEATHSQMRRRQHRESPSKQMLAPLANMDSVRKSSNVMSYKTQGDHNYSTATFIYFFLCVNLFVYYYLIM